jgi:DNA-binding MarR family transcriptional regulator
METKSTAGRMFRRDPKARTFYQFAIYTDYYARCLASMYGATYRLSFSDWKVMAVLGVHAPLSASEAGARTSLRPDKVTRAVDSLVAKRFVLRVHDKEDRRRVVLSLSARGVRAFGEIDRVRYAIESEMLILLDPSELIALNRILDKIRRRAVAIFGNGASWREIVALHEAHTKAAAERGAPSSRRVGARKP